MFWNPSKQQILFFDIKKKLYHTFGDTNDLQKNLPTKMFTKTEKTWQNQTDIQENGIQSEHFEKCDCNGPRD